jgi:hypothetical protein
VRKLRLLLPFALLTLLLGFALAACGSGGESDEDKITGTIETAATSTDPAICKETQTLAFMEQTTGANGKGAEKQCEEEATAGENQPDSVNVSKVEVNGESATAEAAFAGGNLGGQTLELALVDEGGEWKLDELTGFAKFDPESLVKAFSRSIEEEGSIEPKKAGCIIEGVEELSNSALESLVLENNEGPIVEVVEACE